MGRVIALFATGMILSAASLAAEPATGPASPDKKDSAKVSPEQQVAVEKSLQPSLARVEYTFQFDNGEGPVGWDYQEAIRQERPIEQCAFVLSPTEVMTVDLQVHPRFVKSIAVRFGDQVTQAHIEKYARDQDAVVLKLDDPLKDARPLEFDAAEPETYLEVAYARAESGQWTVGTDPFSLSPVLREDGSSVLACGKGKLIVGKSGKPVALLMKDELPLEALKTSPANWPMIPASELEEQLAGLEKRCDASLLRVTLNFRSPPKNNGEMIMQLRRGSESSDATEQNVLGVLVGEKTVLVLANLEPKVTGRLERVTVYPREGDPVAAKFSATLKDYGALLVTLEKPLEGAITLSEKSPLHLADSLQFLADVRIMGENRVAYYSHGRVDGFSLGWRRHLYPKMSGRSEDQFILSSDGLLLALPVSRRQSAAAREPYSRGAEAALTFAGDLHLVLADLAANTDSSNVPLTEDQENRLAWLGVELQPLNQELARANKVSALTKDGETGAMVSFVYPGSPADKAGIKSGSILVRVRMEGQPKPLEVKVEEGNVYGREFPWEQLGMLPEKLFDRLPTPWPSPENSLTRALTDFGFGKKFQADFFCDGQLISKSFEVVQSPPYYDSAPRYKSKELGITVRDMTYELRRYFQKGSDDPGLIISKVEPGGKAAVAGIKPYEMVMSVNDTPVRTVKEFEQLVGKDGELKLSINRMNRGRVVKIKLNAATQPSTDQAPATALARPE